MSRCSAFSGKKKGKVAALSGEKGGNCGVAVFLAGARNTLFALLSRSSLRKTGESFSIPARLGRVGIMKTAKRGARRGGKEELNGSLRDAESLTTRSRAGESGKIGARYGVEWNDGGVERRLRVHMSTETTCSAAAREA